LGASENKANFLRSYSKPSQHFMNNQNAYRILAGKQEREKPLGRPRHRWWMDLRDTGWDGMDWIDLA
jgi:hypothetical protein